MNKYEIYTVEKDGKIKPTGFSKNGNKLEHVERLLKPKIKDSGKPCVVVTTWLNPNE